MPKKPTIFVVKVTADGITYPPAYYAAVLSMQRYRRRKPDAKPGEVQIVLEYGGENA